MCRPAAQRPREKVVLQFESKGIIPSSLGNQLIRLGPPMWNNLFYSTSTDLNVNHIFQTPSPFRLVFDQICGSCDLVKLIHKINHHTVQLNKR